MILQNPCINCKHHDQEYCYRKNHYDLVKGKLVFDPVPCKDERSSGWFWTRMLELCGQEGRYFVKGDD